MILFVLLSGACKITAGTRTQGRFKKGKKCVTIIGMWCLRVNCMENMDVVQRNLSLSATQEFKWKCLDNRREDGWFLVHLQTTWTYAGKWLGEGGLSEGVALSSRTRLSLHQDVLLSGWSFNRVVSHRGGLSTGWSLIMVVFQQGGLSSGWSFNGVVSHQGGLSTGCSLSRAVIQQGGLLTGWSLIRAVFPQSGLSSGWSFHRVVSHHGGLSTGWSLIRVVF